jgi:hypothetical protein
MKHLVGSGLIHCRPRQPLRQQNSQPAGEPSLNYWAVQHGSSGSTDFCSAKRIFPLLHGAGVCATTCESYT